MPWFAKKRKMLVWPTRTIMRGLLGRGMHCDSPGEDQKTVFSPVRDGVNGIGDLQGLQLRGLSHETDDSKVWAFPVRKSLKTATKAGLAFRTITECWEEAACQNCWSCDFVTHEASAITESPEPYLTVDLTLDDFPGGVPGNLDCCQDQFGGTIWPLQACYQPDPGTGLWLVANYDEGGCEGYDLSGVNRYAAWYGEFTGYHMECDTTHPGDLLWHLEAFLQIWCEDDVGEEEEFQQFASLGVLLYVDEAEHGGLDPVCCMPLDAGYPIEGQGWCIMWVGCWPLEPEESCGAFRLVDGDYESHPLCCINDWPARPCSCLTATVAPGGD